ncbi:hypothetical protein [Planococcus chinensis]|uniref:Uncharacterized protein n=1 Tax=Planococcus chinensis TaxID=272917 RepID=A0ABW4QGR2_9BACL
MDTVKHNSEGAVLEGLQVIAADAFRWLTGKTDAPVSASLRCFAANKFSEVLSSTLLAASMIISRL